MGVAHMACHLKSAYIKLLNVLSFFLLGFSLPVFPAMQHMHAHLLYGFTY